MKSWLAFGMFLFQNLSISPQFRYLSVPWQCVALLCWDCFINFPVNCRNFLKRLKLAECLYHLAKLRLVFKHLRPIDTNNKMSKTYWSVFFFPVTWPVEVCWNTHIHTVTWENSPLCWVQRASSLSRRNRDRENYSSSKSCTVDRTETHSFGVF